MDLDKKIALLEYFEQFLTESRNELFESVLQNRTNHITIALENIYQPQNASAVLRSCDLTGIQDVHIIENNNIYDVNPEVAMGSSKWLNLYKYNEYENNTLNAFTKLREKGYRIVATTPHKNDQTPDTIPLDNKIALVFGTELTGLSDIAVQHADEFIRIPMYGFTESYNISVSAAILLYSLTQRLHQSDINWQLTEEERIDTKTEWAKRTISRSDVIERHFLNTYIS